jgi:hypothetical protein
MKINLESWSNRLLYLLIATDLLFIALHIIYKTTELISDTSFSLSTDRGYPEIFQCVKAYWIALLFLLLAIKKQTFLYLAWSLLFVYLLLDDFMEIHETGGDSISKQFDFPSLFNLRPEDLGELAISIVASLFFLLLIAIGYRFSDSMGRQSSRYMIGMLFMLAFFGIVMDMLHIMSRSLSIEILEDFIALVEDGGEHLVMSVIAWYVFLLFETSPLGNQIFKDYLPKKSSRMGSKRP